MYGFSNRSKDEIEIFYSKMIARKYTNVWYELNYITHF